jgi:hypothetical protein
MESFVKGDEHSVRRRIWLTHTVSSRRPLSAAVGTVKGGSSNLHITQIFQIDSTYRRRALADDDPFSTEENRRTYALSRRDFLGRLGAASAVAAAPSLIGKEDLP